MTLQGSQRFSCHRAVHTSTLETRSLLSRAQRMMAMPRSPVDSPMPFLPSRSAGCPTVWIMRLLAIFLVEAAFRHTLTADRVN